jgi:hypothetical protein
MPEDPRTDPHSVSQMRGTRHTRGTGSGGMEFAAIFGVAAVLAQGPAGVLQGVMAVYGGEDHTVRTAHTRSVIHGEPPVMRHFQHGGGDAPLHGPICFCICPRGEPVTVERRSRHVVGHQQQIQPRL